MGGLGLRSRIGEIYRLLIRKNRAYANVRIARRWRAGYWDKLLIDSGGMCRVEGWCRETLPQSCHPQLKVNGELLPPIQHFRFSRPDVPVSANGTEIQNGVAWEYLIPESAIAGVPLELSLPDDITLKTRLRFPIRQPHYKELLNAERVWTRHDIYGSGPPNGTVHPDVLELAKRLSGPVLDFGCGRGTLVAELLASGIETHGLELDSPILRAAIAPDLRKHITLYDGTLPAPFKEGSYRSVVCSEVLEHIPNYQAAVADIARIARKEAVITVPDSSAIPIGHRHGVVPWHLLEGSHLNFFCQSSLERTLRPFFRRIEFGRVGSSQLNDTSFYVSLTAVCTK